ncbi:MAG: UDP-N-acetylglucosamine 1-carboxyvinyltransferase [Oscillospiraceae bacterium]|nr:UDP-N-acetylglucosamine 1-carboxyvinyltransferase [Oscillospiraceae bacterium]
MKYIIQGGAKIGGAIRISGAKNAALPIIAAAMLGETPSVLHDIPNVSDTRDMIKLVEHIGSYAQYAADKSLKIYLSKPTNFIAPYDIATKLRASFLIMAPMLARFGKIRIPLPGGCPIGTRPVNLHLKGFAAMGAKITQGHGFVEAKARKLVGAKIYLDFPSVGATENIMIAATLAEGQTIIENAAIEPEIVDLANFLNQMGADVRGAGCDTIRINGVKSLFGAEYTIIPDRIEAGTFMTLAAMTRGELLIENVLPDHLKPVISKLNDVGATIETTDHSILISAKDKFRPSDIKTLPYPGFPTDMQAQFTAFMSNVEGTSMVVETVFENRFLHANELARMGANIKIEGRTAVIDGRKNLSSAQVKATDLRAGAALTLAALVCDGVSEISEIHHIERGYENFEQKLCAIGAKINKI